MSEEVFISYSHDSPDHIERVLALSNRLRSEGIDCVLDQYETSPPEGWPRWMDKKVRDSKFVLMACTEKYYQRVMGDEEPGTGLGIRWEGNLIYQHLYNAGAINTKFIPIIFDEGDTVFIPTPVQGTSYYCMSQVQGYDDLYYRLIDQPRTKKPELGSRRPLAEKPVKTNPAMYITGPINVELWNQARWSATFFSYQEGKPPILGLAFKNEAAARKIFENWHERYGSNDQYEELRISIIEGPIKGEDDGYSVHIGIDPDTAIKRYKDAGYSFEPEHDFMMCVSRINRMTPPKTSRNLETFKKHYAQYKTYYLVPGVISADGKALNPLYDLGIFKGRILFRDAAEISEHDIDSVVIGTGEVERKKHNWT